MIGHVDVLCYKGGCSEVVWMDRDVYDRRRRTHESWYCGAGHAQHFTGKSDEQQRIEQLERELAVAQRGVTYWQRRAQDNSRSCPWSGCGRYLTDKHGLHMHMIRAHGMPPLYVVRAEQEAAS